MVIMGRTNQSRQLAHFYKQVAILIKKDKTKRVELSRLEATFKRNANNVFSWMQWTDAKQWFTAGTCDTGICYYLKRHLQDAPIKEIWDAINQHYHLPVYK